MITSVYKEMINLASRKTEIGLELFNSLVESGLVHFLSQKEEKAVKTIEVSAKELAEAREKAEKTLASVKGYRSLSVAKKAIKASRRIFASLSRKVKSLAVMSLDSLKAAESKAQGAYIALRVARFELQQAIVNLAQVKEGNSVRAIYSALKACRNAAFKVEQLSVELAFAKEQVAIVAARQAV